MRPAMIIFGLMVVVGVILYLLDLRGRKTGKYVDEIGKNTSDEPSLPSCEDENCSLHGTCTTQLIVECESKPIEYYDDEELDRFAGRGADEYSNEEIEEFRDILYTLKGNDLLGWQQSVSKRGITLPSPIHDEFIMLYNENK